MKYEPCRICAYEPVAQHVQFPFGEIGVCIYDYPDTFAASIHANDALEVSNGHRS